MAPKQTEEPKIRIPTAALIWGSLIGILVLALFTYVVIFPSLRGPTMEELKPTPTPAPSPQPQAAHTTDPIGDLVNTMGGLLNFVVIIVILTFIVGLLGPMTRRY